MVVVQKKPRFRRQENIAHIAMKWWKMAILIGKTFMMKTEKKLAENTIPVQKH